MDEKGRKGKWDWLPAVMPGVQRLMADKKRTFGEAHVAECWRRGVLLLEPGWLFAREAALSIGTPPLGDHQVMELAFSAAFIDQAFLYMREPEVANGAQ